MPINLEESEFLAGLDRIAPAPSELEPEMVLDQVSHLDPDRSAKVLDLATRTELPTNVVDNNLDDIERKPDGWEDRLDNPE